MGKKLLSIIIPCYNEEKTVETIYVAITDTMDMLPQYDYEILFVNDGSKDNTLNKLTGLSEMDVHVKYYSFSRNFGKEAAIYAGLNNARGDYVVIMDADMQDPPALLPEEFLEAFGVFSGWHCQFFKCSADDFFLPWNFDDVYFFCCNHIYHCSKAYFWRSGQWMAIPGMYHYVCWWNSIVLYGNHGTISV